MNSVQYCPKYYPKYYSKFFPILVILTVFLLMTAANNMLLAEDLPKTSFVKNPGRNSLYLGLGPGLILNSKAEKSGYHVAIGRNIDIDPRAAVRMTSSLTSDSHSYLIDASAAAHIYPMSDKIQLPNVSPFIGGLFGLGYGENRHDTSVGFVAGGSFGLTLFRKSSSPLEVEAQYRKILHREKNGGVGELALRVGVMW